MNSESVRVFVSKSFFANRCVEAHTVARIKVIIVFIARFRCPVRMPIEYKFYLLRIQDVF